MPRIRTITVAGVLAGAAVLGGAGLAGATDRSKEVDDTPTAELQEDFRPTSAEELTTGEPDAPVDETTEAAAEGGGEPRTPELPDEATDRAYDALSSAPAFDTEDDPASDAAPQTDEQPAPGGDEVAQPAERADHGQQVSETARSTESGPGHGEAVSEVARQRTAEPLQ